MIVKEWQVAIPCNKGDASGRIFMSLTASWSVPLTAGTIPHMSRPSSVKVPVLSKQTQLTEPATLMTREFMQKI